MKIVGRWSNLPYLNFAKLLLGFVNLFSVRFTVVHFLAFCMFGLLCRFCHCDPVLCCLPVVTCFLARDICCCEFVSGFVCVLMSCAILTLHPHPQLFPNPVYVLACPPAHPLVPTHALAYAFVLTNHLALYTHFGPNPYLPPQPYPQPPPCKCAKIVPSWWNSY